MFLVTASILALFTVAFLLGRVSVGSSAAPSAVPAVSTQLPASVDMGMCQHFERYISAAC
jgi:hypothetical protein